MSHIQEGSISPVVLLTLLHIHYRTDPLISGKSTGDSVHFLLEMGLIDTRPGLGCGWQTTERGRAHVTQLCQHPFPVPMDGWMNPITKQALT